MASANGQYVDAIPMGIPTGNGNGAQNYVAYPGGVGNPQAQMARHAPAAKSGCSVLSTLALVGLGATTMFAVYLFAFGGLEALFGSQNKIELDPDAFVQVVFANANTDVAANNAFVKAAQTWSSILNGTGVIPATNTLTTFNELCFMDETVAFPNVALIDRIFIVALVAPDDGAGGVLASAGPCAGFIEIEANGFLMPALGVMTFDSDDIDNLVAADELEDVILHEMAHVLGFGTLWDDIRTDPGFPLGGVEVVENIIYPFGQTPQPNNDPIYTGTEGKNGRVDVGGGSFADIEVEDGTFLGLSNAQLFAGLGQGSVDSHWRENIYGNELMTPAISGTVRPLSVMSLRSLRDIGYTVDTSFADSYSFTPSGSIVGTNTAQLKSTAEAHDGHFTVLSNDTFHDPAIPHVLAKLKKSKKQVENGRRRLGGPTYITLAVEAVEEYRRTQAQAST